MISPGVAASCQRAVVAALRRTRWSKQCGAIATLPSAVELPRTSYQASHLHATCVLASAARQRRWHSTSTTPPTTTTTVSQTVHQQPQPQQQQSKHPPLTPAARTTRKAALKLASAPGSSKLTRYAVGLQILAQALQETDSVILGWRLDDYALAVAVLARLHAPRRPVVDDRCTPVTDMVQLRQLRRMLTLAHAAYAGSTEELLQRTGLQAGDVVRAQWGNNLVLPAHFLAVDRDSDTVVVSIRGTYGLTDLIVELSCAAEPIGAGYGHRGVVLAARQVVAELLHPIVALLSQHPDKELVLVGHSFGGAVASIAGLMLREQFPTLQVYTYCTLPCVSLELSQAMAPFVTSLVHGDDIVPRMNVPNMHRTRQDASNIDWAVVLREVGAPAEEHIARLARLAKEKTAAALDVHKEVLFNTVASLVSQVQERIGLLRRIDDLQSDIRDVAQTGGAHTAKLTKSLGVRLKALLQQLKSMDERLLQKTPVRKLWTKGQRNSEAMLAPTIQALAELRAETRDRMDTLLHTAGLASEDEEVAEEVLLEAPEAQQEEEEGEEEVAPAEKGGSSGEAGSGPVWLGELLRAVRLEAEVHKLVDSVETGIARLRRRPAEAAEADAEADATATAEATAKAETAAETAAEAAGSVNHDTPQQPVQTPALQAHVSRVLSLFEDWKRIVLRKPAAAEPKAKEEGSSEEEVEIEAQRVAAALQQAAADDDDDDRHHFHPAGRLLYLHDTGRHSESPGRLIRNYEGSNHAALHQVSLAGSQLEEADTDVTSEEEEEEDDEMMEDAVEAAGMAAPTQLALVEVPRADFFDAVVLSKHMISDHLASSVEARLDEFLLLTTSDNDETT